MLLGIISSSFVLLVIYSFKIACRIHIETKTNKNHNKGSTNLQRGNAGERETVLVWIPTVSQLVLWKYEASGISIVALG